MQGPVFLSFELCITSSLKTQLVLIDIGILTETDCPLEWDPNSIVLSSSEDFFFQSRGFLFGGSLEKQTIIHQQEDLQEWTDQSVPLVRLDVLHSLTG